MKDFKDTSCPAVTNLTSPSQGSSIYDWTNKIFMPAIQGQFWPGNPTCYALAKTYYSVFQILGTYGGKDQETADRYIKCLTTAPLVDASSCTAKPPSPPKGTPDYTKVKQDLNTESKNVVAQLAKSGTWPPGYKDTLNAIKNYMQAALSILNGTPVPAVAEALNTLKTRFTAITDPGVKKDFKTIDLTVDSNNDKVTWANKDAYQAAISKLAPSGPKPPATTFDYSAVIDSLRKEKAVCTEQLKKPGLSTSQTAQLKAILNYLSNACKTVNTNQTDTLENMKSRLKQLYDNAEEQVKTLLKCRICLIANAKNAVTWKNASTYDTAIKSI